MFPDKAQESTAFAGEQPDMPKTDKPLSSTEVAMMELETEIMALDESLGDLTRTLKPVRNASIDKAVGGGLIEASKTDSSQRPVSPIAQSINEKASRVRQIRHRVCSLISSIDL